MNDVTLSIRNLSFDYATSTVLDGLNLNFEPGVFHAIVGPNGSGKSTLLNLLAGHQSPTSGEVLINGNELSNMTSSELAKRMTLVPQETGFHFPFTVFDIVLMGRHPHIPRFSRPSRQDIESIHRSLAAMDLSRLAERTVQELSGGERQRTVFARALAQDTPCLLLDEPTSSMDIRHTLAAMRLLRRLTSQEKRTVVAVLHDLNLAAAHCDHVTILKEGTVYATGAPEPSLTPETIRDVFGVTAHVSRNKERASLNIVYESKDTF